MSKISKVKKISSNCKTYSISGNITQKNDSATEKKEEPAAGKSFFQYRYVVALLGFFVFFQTSFYRLATAISLVAMVNNTAISYGKNSSKSIEICPLNSSSEEEFEVSKIEGDLNWSPDIQGFVLSAGFFSYVISLIPSGMAAEIYGGKIIILIGLYMSTIGHLLSPLAAEFSSSWMILAQLVRGFGQGVCMSAFPIIASNWFPNKERGLFNSIIISGNSAGIIICGISAGAMCSSSFLGGWPSVYYIYGSLGLLQCFCLQIFLYESPKIHPYITETEKNYILHYQEADLNKKRPPTPWKEISKSVPFYALTYAVFGVYWGFGYLTSLHPIYLTTVLQFSLNENGFIIAIVSILQIILTSCTSFVSIWLNNRNVVGVDCLRKGINLIGCLGFSAGLLGVCFAGCDRLVSNSLGIIGMSFIAFNFGGCIIVPMDMSPSFAGTLMGLSVTGGSLSSFILPVIYGVMMEKEQSLEQWNKIFFISIAVVLSSGVIFCFFGSAEIQTWNSVTEDQKRNNSKSSRNVKEEINTAFDAEDHI